MRPADKRWLGLIAYVVACNVWACIRGEEMLSEACDRYLIARRWPTEFALLAFYVHLSNRVPPRYDPIHLAFVAVKRVIIRLRGTV